MLDPELQNILNDFEGALLKDDSTSARTALRKLLFGLAGAPVEGSVGDAVELLEGSVQQSQYVAPILLRAIAQEDFLKDNTRNNLTRNVVAIVERGLPGFYSFFDVATKKQTYEKYEHLQGAKTWFDSKLNPLRIPYTSLESLLAAKSSIIASLSHGRLIEFGQIYKIQEIKDAVESVFSCLEQVAKTQPTLADDVDICERTIADAGQMIKLYPSFITVEYFQLFLQCSSERMYEFIDTLRGRFTASISQDWIGTELPKRYPLLESERRLRILIPFGSDGRGAATDVHVTVTSESNHILFENEDISLGDVSPGKFSVALDVFVVDPVEEVTAILEIEWGEVGTSRRQSALFEVQVFAQAAGIDWDKYTYLDPYGTGPAKGKEFVGRQEQVQTLVARMLRQPMEPSYITGQKRVGKTSLASAAAEQASARDPKHKLAWHYILWGQIAHEDSRISLKQLGERIENFIVGTLPGNANLKKGNYEGSLSHLIEISSRVEQIDPELRFVIIIDEFDEMPQELYMHGNLADTVFGNIRAITTTSNIYLMLVGRENMPFVMDRQGQKLNKYSRVSLTYFDRSTEWDDYVRLIRQPTSDFIQWHDDAVAEVYDLTNGNPYFSKIICSKILARALRERDIDITREEVREAVDTEISRFDDNLFAHLWQDGIFVAVDEREPIVLKRKRVLAAFARCLRANRPATAANIYAHKSNGDLSEEEMKSVLADFVSREVIIEEGGVYRTTLPVFRHWLVDIGLTRLAADALSVNLATDAQRIEDEARVLSEELVALTRGWPTYRGNRVTTDDVRVWLNQLPSSRDQRALFKILKAMRFLSESDILERIRNVRLTVLGLVEAAVRTKDAQRRNDIVVTYVDGEGKSGQKYASLYAEENYVSTTAILPPSKFSEAYKVHAEKHGTPKYIVIVDDLVGTGKSLSTNVKSFCDEHSEFLMTQSEPPSILVTALFATSTGEQALREALTEIEYCKIDFRAGEILDESATIFSESNGIFKNSEERERAKSLAQDIGAKIYKNNPLGYGELGLNIVFPTTVPNNSLPLLHSRGKGASPQWRPLFERLVN